MLSQMMPKGETAEAMDLLPEEIVDTLTISGTPTECARRIDEYEGIADQIVMMRVSQKNEPAGVEASEPMLALVAETKSRD